jgi:hypothetical protein
MRAVAIPPQVRLATRQKHSDAAEDAMSTQDTRERALSIGPLLLVLASSLFVLGAAFGQAHKQENAERAAQQAAVQQHAALPQQNRAATPERKPTVLEETPMVDLSVIYPPTTGNPADDPLALFNTPPSP